MGGSGQLPQGGGQQTPIVPSRVQELPQWSTGQSSRLDPRLTPAPLVGGEVPGGVAAPDDWLRPRGSQDPHPNIHPNKPPPNKIAQVGYITPQPSATGGAYGMPAATYGGPVFKDTAGRYTWDAEGRYPIPPEALALGGFK